MSEEAQETNRTGKRIGLWAALAVLVLAIGALAFAGKGDDHDLHPLPLGATGTAGAERSAAPGAADSMMPQLVVYKAGADLPALGGDGAVYKFAPVTDGEINALAKALGVSGEIKDQDGARVVVDGDHQLTVSGNSWWYSSVDSGCRAAEGGGEVCAGSGSAVAVPDQPVSSPPSSGGGSDGTVSSPPADCSADGTNCSTPSCGPNEDCAVPPSTGECPPVAADGAPETTDCVDPTPAEPQRPADMPTEAEAKSIALALLRDAGFDTESAKVAATDAITVWSISVDLPINGEPVVGHGVYLTIGPKGVVTNAGGIVGSVEKIDDYPIIDTRAAIDRLNDQTKTATDLKANSVGAPVADLDGAGTTTTTAGECPMIFPPPPECGGPSGGGTGTTPPDDGCPGDVTTDGDTVSCSSGGGASGGSGTAGTGTACPGTTDSTATTLPQDGCSSPGSPGTGCKPQPDGRDICEPIEPSPPECSAPNVDCAPTTTVPVEEPEPVTVTLDHVDQILMVVPSWDGKAVFVVPAYSFDGSDGKGADYQDVTVVAIDDEFLQPPDQGSGTGSGSTDPGVPEPAVEPAGQSVTVFTRCDGKAIALVDLNGQMWISDADTSSWSTPTEGGTWYASGDTAKFVGDAAETKTGEFRKVGPDERVLNPHDCPEQK